MNKYQPKSSFLLDILSGRVPLTGGDFGRANLERLIAMTSDEDYSNRDWATFLLAQQEIDTPAVRHALLQSAADSDKVISSEAILGLARIAPDMALPLIRQALCAETVESELFEAAALVADASLVEALRQWEWSSDDSYLDRLVTEAIKACETGIPSR